MSEQNETKRTPKATVTVEDFVLTFAFANGETRTLDAMTLDQSIRDRAIVHGLEQKIRDSYAGAKTPDEALGLADKVLDTLRGGEWSAKREGGVAEGSIEILARAMVNAWAAKGIEKTFEDTLELVKGMDKEGRAAIRSRESVAIELAKLKAKAPTTDDNPALAGL